MEKRSAAQPSNPSTSRRDFLTGRSLRAQAESAGEAVAEALTAAMAERAVPTAGDTVRLGTRAMACDFAVVMNPGPSERVMIASHALDLLHPLEDQMSVYRAESELSRLNRRAATEPVEVEPRLFALLDEARRICDETGGAFDPTSGPLIALWRECRQETRIPTNDELAECLERTGIQLVVFKRETMTIQFDRPGVELNLGGIGKGYALDRVGEFLHEQGLGDWLIHGGYSSIFAGGDHNGLGGWPVGLKNPLFPKQRWATLLLREEAISTSGSGVQHFRHEGQRYGHILDPRNGRPVERMLSATVLAPTAAEADALSTAFFVMGVENARRYCDNREHLKAVLVPPPRGRRLEPVLCNLGADCLFVEDEFAGR